MTFESPVVEIVSTGTEILQGLYPDRNASDLSQLLDGDGFRVRYHHAARDSREDIGELLVAAGRRSDAIVMTGGLGPTEDDVNRDAIARVWAAPTVLDPEAERMMRERFTHRKVPMPERNLVQAMIPRGATVFYNYHGTAPGFGLVPSGESPSGIRAALIAMPGPPKEWKRMWERDARGWLLSRFPGRPRRRVETLHVALMPESAVNERLSDLFTADPRLEVTLLADRGHIRVRLIVTADEEAEVESLVARFGDEVLKRLPAATILSGRSIAWSLEQELNALLVNGRRSIAVAESCTGGMVAARITDVAGASEYFREGFVVYSNEAKHDLLGVSEATLAAHGAVSRECVLEMAAGARKRSGADAGLSISGIAGPGGGTAEKPVGTVWFGLESGDRGSFALHRRLPGSREAIREWACRQGLDLLRRWAGGLPWPE